MPFVQGKCESCGGILTVDPSLKAANCPFCGTAYVVQDSINYYNTTIKVETMHADVVNVTDESSSEGRLKAAKAFMKLKKYDKAEADYKRVTEMTPQNYLGWLGLIESHTCDYSKRIKSASELRSLEDYARSVLAFAPNGSGEELTRNCSEYINNEREKNSRDIEALNSALSNQNAQMNDIEKEITSLTAETIQIQNRVNLLIKSGAGSKRKKGVSGGVIVAEAILIPIGLIGLATLTAVGVFFLAIAFLILGIVILNKVNNFRADNELRSLKSKNDDLRIRVDETFRNKNNKQKDIMSIQNELKLFR